MPDPIQATDPVRKVTITAQLGCNLTAVCCDYVASLEAEKRRAENEHARIAIGKTVLAVTVIWEQLSNALEDPGNTVQ